MQIVQKYNYADLKRKDGATRLYLTPEGEALPSVTTILSKTKDKTFLKEWRARVGEKQAEKETSNQHGGNLSMTTRRQHAESRHNHRNTQSP